MHLDTPVGAPQHHERAAPIDSLRHKSRLQRARRLQNQIDVDQLIDDPAFRQFAEALVGIDARELWTP
jgi:hypothetical protein